MTQYNVPDLNTGGVDISNTLYKIAQMEQAKRQGAASPLEEELKSKQIALEQAKAHAAVLDDYVKGMSIVDPEEWKEFRAYYKGQGVPEFLLPKDNAFDMPPDINGKVVKNKELFEKHRQFILDSYRGAKSGKKFTQEKIYNIDGRTMSIPIEEGTSVDPEIVTGEKGWSFKAPEKETINEFNVFYRGMKAKGMNDAAISAAWDKKELSMKESAARAGRAPKADSEESKPTERQKKWREYNADLKRQGKPTITLEKFVQDEADRSSPLKPLVREAVSGGAQPTGSPQTKPTGGKAFLSSDGKTVTYNGSVYTVDKDGTFTVNGVRMRVKKK